MAGRFFHPTDFVQRFHEKLVQLRRVILFRCANPILRFRFVLLLKGDRCLHIINSRGIGRKLELRQNGIDHVAFALHQVRQQNFILDQLGSFLRQIGLTCGEQLLKALPCLGPIFFQKWDLREIEARIPKLRVDPRRFSQCSFGLVIVALPHQDNAAQIF